MFKNILETIVRVLKFSIHLISSFAIELYLQLVLFQVGDCEGCREKIKKELKRECDQIAQFELSIFLIVLTYAVVTNLIIHFFKSSRYIETVLYLYAFTISVPILMRVKAILKPEKNNDLSLVCFPDEIIKRVKSAPWELVTLGLMFGVLGKIFGLDVKEVVLFSINVITLGAISYGIGEKLSSK